jgi:excisionase family DNA binding protein
MKSEQLQKLLTYDQLADLLQVSPGTLRNWVSQQYIPYLKIGKNVRFSQNAIEQWLKKRAHYGRLQIRNI